MPRRLKPGMVVLVRVSNSVTDRPKEKPRLGSTRDLHSAKLGDSQAYDRSSD
jgi:hypothetical protein